VTRLGSERLPSRINRRAVSTGEGNDRDSTPQKTTKQTTLSGQVHSATDHPQREKRSDFSSQAFQTVQAALVSKVLAGPFSRGSTIFNLVRLSVEPQVSWKPYTAWKSVECHKQEGFSHVGALVEAQGVRGIR
jgi:hypothetical protein